MASDFIDRSKEIELGQAKNQALEILKLEYVKEMDCKVFLEQHKDMYFELVKLIYTWNSEINQVMLKKKPSEPIPTATPKKDDKQFPTKKCPNPKCQALIPIYFKQHFACGWKEGEE